MKVVLRPNAELELLTQDELRQVVRETLAGWNRPAQTGRPRQTVQTDGSGNANGNANGLKLYVVRPGQTFRLHRLFIRPEASTFGVPYTSNTGYVEIMRGERAIDGFPLTAPGIPKMMTWGTADGPLYKNGDELRIDIYGGPVSAVIIADAQGTIKPANTDE